MRDRLPRVCAAAIAVIVAAIHGVYFEKCLATMNKSYFEADGSHHPSRPVLNRLGDVRRLAMLRPDQIGNGAPQLARWVLRLSTR